MSRILSAQSSSSLQLILAESESEDSVLTTSDLRLEAKPGLVWNTFRGSIPPTGLSRPPTSGMFRDGEERLAQIVITAFHDN